MGAQSISRFPVPTLAELPADIRARIAARRMPGDTSDVEGREEMLHRLHTHRVAGEAGGVVQAADMTHRGRHFHAIEVGPAGKERPC